MITLPGNVTELEFTCREDYMVKLKTFLLNEEITELTEL